MKQREHRKETQRSDAGRDDVHETRFADGLPRILCGDEEERRERHRLPSEQKQERVVRYDEERHGRSEKAKKKAELTAGLRMIRLLPIAESVNGSERRDEKDLREKHRRDAVDLEGELSAGHAPWNRHAARFVRGQNAEGANETACRTRDHEERGQSLSDRRPPRKQEAWEPAECDERDRDEDQHFAHRTIHP